MATSVIKGVNLDSPLGNGRNFSITSDCELIEVSSDSLWRKYIVKSKGWTLQVSGFVPSGGVPLAGQQFQFQTQFGSGSGFVVSSKQGADVGGLASYDLTVQGSEELS